MTNTVTGVRNDVDMNVDDLGAMCARQFLDIKNEFREVYKRFDGVDRRFDRIDKDLAEIKAILKKKL